MIIYSKKQGVLGVEYRAKKGGPILGRFNFIPGYNDISKEIWDMVRPEVKGHLDRGILSEKYVKVEKEKVVEAKEFKDLEPEQKEEIVEDTYNEETLDDWKKEEGGQDGVRAAIVNQKEKIKTYSPKDKKSKKK